ncbi:MAG: hypothetical protein EA398_14745 [Deltaproteobacteria bacterium]|nr:MAG: hypothetical protein EA398_14745 [Deltaproteobacteria bacterium]
MTTPRIQTAVLLAAGRGARLRPFTDDRPKCLVPVRGQRLLDRLLDQLAAAGVRELVVSTGYRAEMVMAAVDAHPAGLRAHEVYNADHATTNNVVSLWRALGHGAARRDPGVVVVETDLWLPAGLWPRLLVPGRLAVDRFDPERMDGTVLALAEDGGVSRLWVGGAEASGAAGLWKTVNVTALSAEDVVTVLGELEALVEGGRTGCYYEEALALALHAGRLRMRAVRLEGEAWAEVDTPEDLERASMAPRRASAR